MWKTIFTIDTWHKDYHKTVDQIRTKWSTVFLCSHLYDIIKEIKKQDRRGRMEHNLLSLDFWQDTVTYEGHSGNHRPRCTEYPGCGYRKAGCPVCANQPVYENTDRQCARSCLTARSERSGNTDFESTPSCAAL